MNAIGFFARLGVFVNLIVISAYCVYSINIAQGQDFFNGRFFRVIFSLILLSVILLCAEYVV